jgi:hypothetical protein
MSVKNPSDSIGNRTRDLPACSAVPQPTTPRRTPLLVLLQIIIEEYVKILTHIRNINYVMAIIINNFLEIFFNHVMRGFFFLSAIVMFLRNVTLV